MNLILILNYDFAEWRWLDWDCKTLTLSLYYSRDLVFKWEKSLTSLLSLFFTLWLCIDCYSWYHNTTPNTSYLKKYFHNPNPSMFSCLLFQNIFPTQQMWNTLFSNKNLNKKQQSTIGFNIKLIYINTQQY